MNPKPIMLKDGRRVWVHKDSALDPKAYAKALDRWFAEYKADLRAASKKRRTKGKKGGRK